MFALTAEGVAAAEEAAAERPPGSPPDEASDRRIKLRDAFFQLGAAVRQIGVTGDDQAVDKALEALAEARRAIYAVLADAE